MLISFISNRREIKRLIILLVLLTLSPYTFCEDKWVNFIGNQSCTPRNYLEPITFDELCNNIKEAASQGFQVRAIGNGYSISDIGCTHGCLLNLKNLNRILSVNLENKTVRVEAGISLHEFNEQLAAYGLALSNQAAIDQISLGGALNTGVHGTGHTGTLSSFIKEIELITSDGTLHKLSEISDPESFIAASVGLGSLGVIYAVTLQCEPLFYLNASSREMDLESVIANYKKLHSSNDFFQFSWNVESGRTVIHQWNRSNPSIQNIPSESVASYKALPWYAIDENDKDLFSEIAVPIDALPKAVEKIEQLAKKYIKLGAKITDITIRFVEHDKHAYLSPASDGPVAYIALCILEKDKYLAFYMEAEEALYNYQGRPHWGKIHFLNYERAIHLYGTKLQKFIDVKNKLDPQGIFSNDFTNRILIKS